MSEVLQSPYLVFWLIDLDVLHDTSIYERPLFLQDNLLYFENDQQCALAGRSRQAKHPARRGRLGQNTDIILHSA